MKGVDEEEPPVFVQGASNPDGERDADNEVKDVSTDDVVHVISDSFYVFRFL
jgi:hypothetical protein